MAIRRYISKHAKAFRAAGVNPNAVNFNITNPSVITVSLTFSPSPVQSNRISTMAFGVNALIAVLIRCEDYIVAQILRSPGFHHNVRKIHRRVHEYQHGRNPHEPLYPGEATELPNSKKDGSFLKHFVEELRNQVRGSPTDLPPSKGPQPPRR